MKNKIYQYMFAGLVVCGMAATMTSCSDDKDFGDAMAPATLVSELKTNVGNTLTLAPGMSQQVTAEIVTQGVTYPELSWASTDESVVTVSQDGQVNALKVGEANILIKQAANNNTIKSFAVKVKPQATAITLAPVSVYQRSSQKMAIAITPADGYDLFEWSSSDESIATVDANGVITASREKYGTVTITARSKDGSNLTASTTLTVKELVPITSIILDGPGFDLSIGASGKVYTTLVPSDATAELLEWTSSDDGIVTVDSKGVVTGVAYGTATVTAKAESGVTQTIDITVGEGAINQVFANNMGSWKFEQSGSSASFDGTCMTVSMSASGSNWRGDFGPSVSPARPKMLLNVGTYRYFAVKMTRPGAYQKAANKPGGTIVLDTEKGRFMQKTGNGNNMYSILGHEGTEGDVAMSDVVVIYFDLQEGFGNTPFLYPTDATYEINLFKLLIADVPNTYSSNFQVYWAHTFKSVAEMTDFVNNKDK